MNSESSQRDRGNPRDPADITVPLGLMAGRENESLRSPPRMDRADIVLRLVEIRDFDPARVGGFFKGIEKMSPARIGARVIAALNWMQDNPGHPFVSEQLQLVALNLKHLEE